MSISEEARLAIKDVFEEEVYQDWISKWPGKVRHPPFVTKYTTALADFHLTFPTGDHIPETTIGSQHAAEEHWTHQRCQNLEEGYLVNGGRDKNYPRAFLERLNEALFMELMQRNPQEGVKPVEIEDLQAWEWTLNYGAYRDSEEIHTELLEALVVKLVIVAEIQAERALGHVKGLLDGSGMDPDEMLGSPGPDQVIGREWEIGAARMQLQVCDEMLEEVEDLWKGKG
ncbi:unnamed protein product [Zymoseptoria tritici ST99CH_1A5]|uniref:Uncharacterized protein n=1 Tax=Zymoseptoria tritici ST99CH_1A5 TaxID=1276529 RepID=A0A1Y6LZ15_ZYMTR|nr:unnamed protein product [Zymoseptoria tritici ST99CH_1A5]